jgi:hypothetical protein
MGGVRKEDQAGSDADVDRRVGYEYKSTRRRRRCSWERWSNASDGCEARISKGAHDKARHRDGACLLERGSSKDAAGAVKDEEVEAGGGSRLLNDFLCADLPRHIDRLGRNLLSYPHAFQLW